MIMIAVCCSALVANGTSLHSPRRTIFGRYWGYSGHWPATGAGSLGREWPEADNDEAASPDLD